MSYIVTRIKTDFLSVDKIIKTKIDKHKYEIELICSNEFLEFWGRNSPTMLVLELLGILVSIAKYFSGINKSFETIEIICHTGKNTHYISTPFDFLLKGRIKGRKKNRKIVPDLIGDWCRITRYKFIEGK